MPLADIESIGRSDALYIAPHAGDVIASCPARLADAVGRGQQTLIVTLFGPGPRDAGPHQSLALGWPEAPRRDARYAAISGVLFGEHEGDATIVREMAGRLDALARHTQARHVYAPLAAGGHVDHRLAHLAALAAFGNVSGRDVFLYEDRPYALVRGAVRVRLGQLGVRLPPGAGRVDPRLGLLGFLLRSQAARHRRALTRGIGERLASLRGDARAWRETRAWNPLRAFGLRLQPVLQPAATPPPAVDASDAAALCGAGAARPELAADYARRLGAGGFAERYWLLLPAQEGALQTQSAAALAS